MSEGYNKFKETAEKIKDANEQENSKKEEEVKLSLNSLKELELNTELAQLYNENASVGAENLNGELPLLKVHSTGRSTRNELNDGSEPNNGWFFYKPTKEQYEVVNCHILTISRGFRADGIAGSDGKTKENVFNQILGGVILDGAELKPFIMYITGLKLQYLWNFAKEAAKYTKMKPVSIPMFALTVKMTTKLVTNNYGKSWIVDYEIIKTAEGTPLLVTDAGEFQFLRDHVETIKDTVSSLISAKATDDDADKPVELKPVKTDVQSEGEVDEIPFKLLRSRKAPGLKINVI